jgi:hypothetical protein
MAAAEKQRRRAAKDGGDAESGRGEHGDPGPP